MPAAEFQRNRCIGPLLSEQTQEAMMTRIDPWEQAADCARAAQRALPRRFHANKPACAGDLALFNVNGTLGKVPVQVASAVERARQVSRQFLRRHTLNFQRGAAGSPVDSSAVRMPETSDGPDARQSRPAGPARRARVCSFNYGYSLTWDAAQTANSDLPALPAPDDDERKQADGAEPAQPNQIHRQPGRSRLRL